MKKFQINHSKDCSSYLNGYAHPNVRRLKKSYDTEKSRTLIFGMWGCQVDLKELY